MDIIFITNLVLLPAVSNLTTQTADFCARSNARHISFVASAKVAGGDPGFKSPKTKAAMVAYVASGGGLVHIEGMVASIGLSKITVEEAYSASRFLKIGTSGQLQFSQLSCSPLTNSGAELAIRSGVDDQDLSSEEKKENDQAIWNAQLLEGAFSLAVANGDEAL